MRMIILGDYEDNIEKKGDLIRKVCADINKECVLETFEIANFKFGSIGIYDVAFICVCYDKFPVFKFVKFLRTINPDCIIVFWFDSYDYLDEAFDLNIFRYLVEPVTVFELMKCIHSIFEKHVNKLDVIEVTVDKVIHRVNVSDIIYIENSNRHTLMVINNGEFLAKESFKFVMSQINKKTSSFIQTHQSFFVNIRYVVGYNDKMMTLHSGNRQYKVYVSRRKYPDLCRSVPRKILN